jgi:pimeloyl-ACP methyl ester carboxylesterase
MLITGSLTREKLFGTGIELLVPGFRGEVTKLSPGEVGRSRGEGLPVADAAAGTGAVVGTQLLLDLTADSAGVTLSDHSRAVRSPPPRLFVQRRKGMAYALLQTDDVGVSRVILPDEVSAPEAVFTLTPKMQANASRSSRGAVTASMRHLLRLLVWAIQPGLDRGALAIARRWENERRPNKLVQVMPDGRLESPDWRLLSSGPVLLLLHGTFSTPEAAFAGWVGHDSFAYVAQRYQGRCLAFAHPTLAVSPDDNVEWLVSNLGRPLVNKVDLVSHSRGGLIARAIAATGKLDVRRVCLLGTPNQGTQLADVNQVMNFLDGHTALLTKLPDSVTTVILEGVLCIVKLLAFGAIGGLPGLNSMQPNGDYLRGLATRKCRADAWYTVGANYRAEALNGVNPAKRVGDTLLDRVFAGANDLVVPTAGCHLADVDVRASLSLDGADAHHTNYFYQSAVQEKLRSWLD